MGKNKYLPRLEEYFGKKRTKWGIEELNKVESMSFNELKGIGVRLNSKERHTLIKCIKKIVNENINPKSLDFESLEKIDRGLIKRQLTVDKLNLVIGMKAFAKLFGATSEEHIGKVSPVFLKRLREVRKKITIKGETISHKDFIERVVGIEHREKPIEKPYIEDIKEQLRELLKERDLSTVSDREIKEVLSKNPHVFAAVKYYAGITDETLGTAVKMLLNYRSNL